jgi:hypothetical protein
MIPRLIPVLASILLLLGLPGRGLETAAIDRTKLEFFEKKIRPILADNCYKCHSLESGKSKGGLTLDTREAMLRGGKDGEILKPGDPAASRLLVAVSYDDPDLQMPPKGEKLSAQQIADLTEWVKMGAPDPRDAPKPIGSGKLTGLTDTARKHWAYQPVKKPAIPSNKNQQWCRTPVDAFILQKLEEKNMVPAPDAEKEALLRRATYDLIGLPPETDEVKAFLADTSPNAFAKVVDRLLASPHYGERWGRFWLDTARYSDTTGGERNALRGQDYRYAYAWTYRDYVINAFNEDKPYDQFIIEQLAADKLPDIDKDKTRLAALGFITVGERFRNPNDIINDRIDVVSKGFLAMTVTCARCHDHMFDPIPTSDYYALHGVFASTIEPKEKPLLTSPTTSQRDDFEKRLAALENENREVYYRYLNRALEEVHTKIGSYLLAGRQLVRKGGKGGAPTAEQIKERNEILKSAKLDRFTIQPVLRAVRFEDEIFAPFRMFAVLDEKTFAEKATEVVARIVANSENRRSINPLVAAAFKDTQPKSLRDVADIYTKLFSDLSAEREKYIAACAHATDGTVTGFAPELVQLLQTPYDILPASKCDTASLRDFIQRLPQQAGRRVPFVFAKINELELTHPGAPARAMMVTDAQRPRDSAVFIRGQAENRGPIVPRHFLEVLSPAGKPAPFKEGSGRLELARCIASKSNPLTARVMVNRVWMHHFGEGFVRTPDDLGTQSEAPSHPELLDYLSWYFMENGWSLKRLHKLVMLSRVYQESTRTVPEFETIDPNNRLLWRANLRRLDFEAMRDSLLVFSGDLDRTVGGQPINLTEEPYSYRRSVYGYIDRGNLPDIMANFDFSDPDMPNSKRTSTIVPQQALFLMNSPMSIDVARRINARADVAEAPDNLAKIFAIYRVIFQRAPKPQEIQLALSFVGTEAKNQPEAEEFQTGGDRPKMERRRAALRMKMQQNRQAATRPIQNEGERVERKPLNAWETYTQALLLSNEAAYVN